MAKSASGKYQGSLSLEWFNKQKAILLLGDEDAKREGDIPAPRINWINRDDALFYEIDEEEGKGLTPYWVDRNDIRVKEARPLVFKKAYIAEAKERPGSLPGMDVQYEVKESKVDDQTIQNWLIKGDNLLALNALKRHFDKLPDDRKVKCIYIDPPYNIGMAFKEYDDNLAHSEWLTLMRDRLVLLHDLLSGGGSFWIQLDDKEVFYCKVLLDEVFGRENFVSSIVWQKVFAKKNKAQISSSHDIILVYCKDKANWERNLLKRSESHNPFWNPDNDPRGEWQSVSYSVQSESSEKRKAYRYKITAPSGRDFYPPSGRHWNGLPERTNELIKDNRLWFGADGNRLPRIKIFRSEVQEGIVPDSWWTEDVIEKAMIEAVREHNYPFLTANTWWSHVLSGNNQEAKKEILTLFGGEDPFSTPKPERLLQRVIQIASNEGDIVLDCFAGSGTTLAVAQKMRRRWIGVEVGAHAESLVCKRLKAVISGTDKGGVSLSENLTGGGAFSYYHLGPSIINVDKMTGKGEFNWSLGREFLQESLLQSYDFKRDTAIKLDHDLIGDLPAIGRLESPKGVIFGVAWLAVPDEPVVSIDAETVQALYNTLKEHGPKSIHVFTNKGWDIKRDVMPLDMEIIKVPHAIFAELER